MKRFIALFMSPTLEKSNNPEKTKNSSILKNKAFVAIIFGLFFTLILALFAYTKLFGYFQLQFADKLYNQQNPSPEITIVGLDNNTISQEKGLGDYQAWSRKIYAQVLDNINKYHPKLVLFDFNFRSKKDDEGDLAFQKALSQTERPIIIYFTNPDTFDKQTGYFLQTQAATDPPLDLFSKISNLVVGTSRILLDSDNVGRRIMPIIFDKISNDYHENISFAASRRSLGDAPKPLQPDLNEKFYNINLPNSQKLSVPLEDGQMLINYFSNPEGKNYKNVSFLDVYNQFYDTANSPEQLFKDKIVLIGPTAPYFKDAYSTPVNKVAPMNGIEIQANALQTILDQKFLRNLSLAEDFILILLFCLISAFVFMYSKLRWSLLYLLGLPAIYTLLAEPAFNHGIILDLVHPYVAIVSLFMAIYIYRYITEFKDKIYLKNAFGKYVSPHIVDQLLLHPENLKLGGEKREITVLFTDIAHFTSISEKLKPESLVALLNEYFEAMSEVILAQGGTLDKFEGDAIMAFFGAPLSQTDHAIRACKTILLMRQRLNLLLQKWQNDPPLPGGEAKPQIDFRCGISSGEVIVGNVGSKDRFDYTVMGDIVNLGSRLEGANKKYNTHVILSEQTALQIEKEFEIRELDFIKVVGKTQPIKVFELLNIKGGLVPQALQLLELYKQGIQLYKQRKFAEALEHFRSLLKDYPNDGPSKLYEQRCEVLKDFPPAENWDGVFEMGSK